MGAQKTFISLARMLLCISGCILCAGCGKQEMGAIPAVQPWFLTGEETAGTDENMEHRGQEAAELTGPVPEGLKLESEAEKPGTETAAGAEGAGTETGKSEAAAGTEGVETEAEKTETAAGNAPGEENGSGGNVGPEETSGPEGNAGPEEYAVAEETAKPETPLLEQLFTYETSWYPGTHLRITGIKEEYEENFWQYMEEIRDNYGSEWYLVIPGDINGIPVWEIAEGAFADRQMYGVLFPDSVEEIGEEAFRNTGIKEVVLPANLERVGARAFESCNLERIAFPDREFVMEEKAFAGSKNLISVLIPDVETKIGENVFDGCASDFCIYYGTGQEEKYNRVLSYAAEYGYAAVEVIASDRPFVRYHEEPLVLKPEVRNFFYGDDEEDYELWCSWEEDENAPNFGYPDWQWSGCSSWCGCIEFDLEAEASSELSSASGRYAAENVLWQSREAAWAEGVEGPGIGESITCFQRCLYWSDRQWELFTPDNPEPVDNNLYHYSEICIVNGYAKNQKTWEENGRVKRFAMYVEGRLYAYLELEDTIFPQYFALPAADIIVPNGGTLEVRFEIEEVYPGSLYEDTCLTGLVMEFEGRYSH